MPELLVSMLAVVMGNKLEQVMDRSTSVTDAVAADSWQPSLDFVLPLLADFRLANRKACPILSLAVMKGSSSQASISSLYFKKRDDVLFNRS